MASTAAFENIGAIVVGYLIERSSIPHIPIARPVQQAPDLISFLKEKQLFFFHEVKCSSKYKFNLNNNPSQAIPLVEYGIKDLHAGVCDVFRIVFTYISEFDPLKVYVDIIEMDLQRKHVSNKPKKRFRTILHALENELIAERLLNNTSIQKSLTKILGEEMSKNICEANFDDIKKIYNFTQKLQRELDEEEDPENIFPTEGSKLRYSFRKKSDVDLKSSGLEEEVSNLETINLYKEIKNE